MCVEFHQDSFQVKFHQDSFQVKQSFKIYPLFEMITVISLETDDGRIHRNH